jgi:hypothetical protein
MSFLEYLDFIANPAIYGTEYDIVMFCEFFGNINLFVYIFVINGGKW